jgi:putative FmdB family regulatory protein
MPFYEYECPKCGYQEEVLQKITDKPLTKCPSCGKNSLRKLMSAPVFRLKGSGWYETDFKSDKENKRNLHGADKEEAKAETKAETPKTETPKTETAKPEAAKPEAAKPATDKPAAKPTRRSVARSKPKAKAARTAKRLSRR